MIDLYYWPTPKGWKVTILFEELDHPYNLRSQPMDPDSWKILFQRRARKSDAQ